MTETGIKNLFSLIANFLESFFFELEYVVHIVLSFLLSSFAISLYFRLRFSLRYLTIVSKELNLLLKISTGILTVSGFSPFLINSIISLELTPFSCFK